MSTLIIEQFACRQDNYGVLVHDPMTGDTAAIDAPDGTAVLRMVETTGWDLTDLWITHHHPDHVEGIPLIRQKLDPKVVGPEPEAGRIAGLDETYGEGDSFTFSGRQVEIFHTPGHTLGHICYHIPSEKLLFAGDTLFALGCGRLFEGTPADMWSSLQKLMALPDDTTIYCGHEYTLANARFAISVDPENPALTDRYERIVEMRENDVPTLPTALGYEKRTNPFLRVDDPKIRAGLAMQDATDLEVFTELRRRKDSF
ncbi:hydroxyacylglutathione hydrolase [Pseudohoeflea coraliihabitans]|uniref:Hydroxyacylglutathione hydrolase n=1 Tax=Pseudohoeflea coraliihabitans TaxID=2860393 RepID=A0ABS6WL77_9HYPH|nr:hydroxyacylglutathione hydrolase [Pseudohoeflea sp. DP4N28-3]MBW3096530.1 hydroxyacylglutathione hydrolase [Pseudohoeflea sp. DP4N28-3]